MKYFHKKNFNKKYFLISNIVILLQLIIVVLIYPLLTNSYDGTYKEQLDIAYGSINKYKLPIFLIILFFLNSSVSFLKNKYILSLIFIILSFFIFLIIPSHCPLNMCQYYKPNIKNSTNKKYVNFFALGDIQLVGGVFQDKKWKNRIYASEFYINSINKFVEKINNEDLKNIDIELKEDRKKILLDIIKEKNIDGLLNVGDCTQYGNNIGRLYGPNDVGLYEYGFSNNPQDKGLLKIPSFEVLGNHDYDYEEKKGFLNTIKYYLVFEGNPLVNMQLRRNKNRQYLKDKDKYGNYLLNIDDLNVIVINVWPSKDKLLNGEAKGSLEFLEKVLKKYKNNKWLMLTHYMPTVNKTFDDEITVFGEEEGKLSRPLTDFGKIYKKYKNNSLGVIYGHLHRKEMAHFTNNELKHFNVPGPAYYYSDDIDIPKTREFIEKVNIELPLFSYVKKTKKLEFFKINVKKINGIMKYNISEY